MTPSQVLIQARARIADPRHHGQHFYAFDVRGHAVSPADASAVRFCALGAVYASGGVAISDYCKPVEVIRALDYLQHAARVLYNLSTPAVNDDYGHAPVMEIYDEAIERAERDEAVAEAQAVLAQVEVPACVS